MASNSGTVEAFIQPADAVRRLIERPIRVAGLIRRGVSCQEQDGESQHLVTKSRTIPANSYQTIGMPSRSKTFKPHSPPPGQKETPPASQFAVFRGLLLALFSGVFYSSAAVLVKQMTNLHPGQLSVYRFIGILALSLPQTVQCGENPFGPRDFRFLLFLRGIFGATNLFLNFLAFRYLPLGEAAVIIFSVPVFVTVAARVFLKEPCGIFQSVTVALTVIGIIFTAHLPSRLSGSAFVYTTDNIYGLLAAIAGLVFSTCRFIVIRKVRSVHHAVIMFNFGWVAIIETVSLTFFVGEFHMHHCGIQSFYIILLGLLSYAGQTLLTMALQCELAGPVATMRAAADIVLAFLWQTFLFRDIPDLYSIAGAFLVGFSVVFAGLRKWVSSLPDDSRCRKKLGWMTA